MGISEGDMRVVTFESDRRQVMKGDIGPMHPTLTYLLEPSDGGTTFTRHVQISVSGWMKIMSPMMGMMLPKQNKGFLANLKRVLEERGIDQAGASRRNPATNSGQSVSVAPPPAASARIPSTICSPADP
jgi:hypothetical protein